MKIRNAQIDSDFVWKDRPAPGALYFILAVYRHKISVCIKRFSKKCFYNNFWSPFWASKIGKSTNFLKDSIVFHCFPCKMEGR